MRLRRLCSWSPAWRTTTQGDEAKCSCSGTSEEGAAGRGARAPAGFGRPRGLDKRGNQEGGGCNWSRVELDQEDPEGDSVEWRRRRRVDGTRSLGFRVG